MSKAAGGLPIEYRPQFDRQSGRTSSPDKASVEVARRIIDDLVQQGYQVGDPAIAKVRILDAPNRRRR